MHAHATLLLLSRAAFDHLIAFHRTALSKTQHVTIPICYCCPALLSTTSALATASHSTEGQNVTIPFCTLSLALLSTALFLSPHCFFGDTARHHIWPFALAFSHCFRPLYCFSQHCFFGDTERHHTLLHSFFSAALDRTVFIALHFPTETQNVMHTSTLRYPVLLFCLLLFLRCFLLHCFHAWFWLCP